ncbi:MAG: acyl carrier protein [Spirochaetales bacterium]|nr:acyl carrier protein [Spirochaetales bacterium]
MGDPDQALKQIIISNCGMMLSPEKIREDMNLFTDLQLDSIRIVNIIADIEMRFGIAISLDQDLIDMLKEYRSLRSFLSDKLNQRERDHCGT